MASSKFSDDSVPQIHKYHSCKFVHPWHTIPSRLLNMINQKRYMGFDYQLFGNARIDDKLLQKPTFTC